MKFIENIIITICIFIVLMIAFHAGYTQAKRKYFERGTISTYFFIGDVINQSTNGYMSNFNVANSFNTNHLLYYSRGAYYQIYKEKL